MSANSKNQSEKSRNLKNIGVKNSEFLPIPATMGGLCILTESLTEMKSSEPYIFALFIEDT